jgi:type IV secretion system protein VirB1
MLLDALALAGLLHSCLPSIGPRTMAAIVSVESGSDTDAIHDNTTGRAYLSLDDASAIAQARQLLGRGHNLDLGLAQINSDNLPSLGLSVADTFDPCTNLQGGGHILSEDYRNASAAFGEGQYALRRAIGAYNTGSIFSGYGYVSNVLAAAGLSAADDFPVPDIASLRAVLSNPAVPAKPAAKPARRVAPASHPVTFTPLTSPIAISKTAKFAPGFSAAKPATGATTPEQSSLSPSGAHF